MFAGGNHKHAPTSNIYGAHTSACRKNDSSESKPNIKKSRSACEGNVRAERAASTAGVCVFCVFSRLSSHESSPQIYTHVCSSCGFPSATFTHLTNAPCSDMSSSAWLLALVRMEHCCCCWTGVGGKSPAPTEFVSDEETMFDNFVRHLVHLH